MRIHFLVSCPTHLWQPGLAVKRLSIRSCAHTNKPDYTQARARPSGHATLSLHETLATPCRVSTTAGHGVLSTKLLKSVPMLGSHSSAVFLAFFMAFLIAAFFITLPAFFAFMAFFIAAPFMADFFMAFIAPAFFIAAMVRSGRKHE